MTQARDLAVKMARRRVGDLLRVERFIVVAAHWTVHDCYTVASNGRVYAAWDDTTKQWFYYRPIQAFGLSVVARAALFLSPSAKQLDEASMGALLVGGYPALVKRRLQT